MEETGMGTNISRYSSVRNLSIVRVPHSCMDNRHDANEDHFDHLPDWQAIKHRHNQGCHHRIWDTGALLRPGWAPLGGSWGLRKLPAPWKHMLSYLPDRCLAAELPCLRRALPQGWDSSSCSTLIFVLFYQCRTQSPAIRSPLRRLPLQAGRAVEGQRCTLQSTVSTAGMK